MPELTFEINPFGSALKERKCFTTDRDDLPGQNFPFWGDHFETIPEQDWEAEIAKKVDGESIKDLHIPDVKDQDGVGSCAAESATAGLQIVRSFAGLETVLLNPWTSYCFTSGGVDRGSSISGNMRQLRDVGVLSFEDWPRSKGWRGRPDRDLLQEKGYRLGEVYEVSSKLEVGSALLNEFCVCYGRSGHAITAVQLVSRTLMKYLNSWGSWTNCNDRGFGIESVMRGTYGAFAYRTPKY